ncbi:MAG: hypothetical protein M0D55_06455 [Elusimicrobiota bacterium]|nr:MAG: hypothetical protein M0D55_06455 [Elusimicrobiota bacterium]
MDAKNRGLRRTAKEWFGVSVHPNALFDVYPTTAGRIMLLHGGGAISAKSVKEVEAKYLGLNRGFARGGFALAEYNPFLSAILRAGESGAASEIAIGKFLQKAPALPPGIAMQAWKAQFFLWARNEQWDRFEEEALNFPKSIWAVRFLSEHRSPKARRAMIKVISNAGISEPVLNEIKSMSGDDVSRVLMRVRDGKIRVVHLSIDGAGPADVRQAERIRNYAARLLLERTGGARGDP